MNLILLLWRYYEICNVKRRTQHMLSLYLSIIDNEQDKDKFEQLYLTYKQDMYAVAYHILHNQFDAEDAVHDAFIRIAKNIEKIFEIKCPETHAFTVIIVRNTAINIYNKNKKSSENTCNLDDCYELSIEDEVIKEMDYEDLIESIKSLPDSLRDALYIRCVIGYSTKNTADLLGITIDATHKRIQRAKKILAKNINNIDSEVKI